MGVVSLAVLTIGVVAYTSQESFKETVNDGLKDRIGIYRDPKHKHHKGVKNSFNAMQKSVCDSKSEFLLYFMFFLQNAHTLISLAAQMLWSS